MNLDYKQDTVPQTETKPLISKFRGEGKNIILGITGTSGAIYGLRVLRALLMNEFNVDLILTEYAVYSLYKECSVDIKQSNISGLFPDINITKSTLNLHNNLDLKSEIFSTDYNAYGMIISPCANNFLAGIANGDSKTLMEKAADYSLSYSKPLIIVPRMTPVNNIQLHNMIKIINAGGKIVPAMPSFENNPQNFNDLADYIAGKVLNLLVGNRMEI
jgi:4-hydroxy-3-polyprenylbenzoate decarboxylase